MLNKNSLQRLAITDMALHGVVELRMRRQHGPDYVIRATLLPLPRECATINTEEYYRDRGTTRAKAARERAKKKALLDEHATWQDRFDRHINLLYVVDADECRWKPVSLRALVAVGDWEPMVAHPDLIKR